MKNAGPYIAKITSIILLSLILAAFFLFVGAMKAFAPIPELVQHHAWTVHLPYYLGRAVGWSEMGCSLLLIAGLIRPSVGMFGAATLLINQICAAIMHLGQHEYGALPQNAVIMAVCSLIWMLQSSRRASRVMA